MQNGRFELRDQVVGRPANPCSHREFFAEPVVRISTAGDTPGVHLLHGVRCDLKLLRIAPDCEILAGIDRPFEINWLIARLEESLVLDRVLNACGDVVDLLSIHFARRIVRKLIKELLPHRTHLRVYAEHFAGIDEFLAIHTPREADIEVWVDVVSSLMRGTMLEVQLPGRRIPHCKSRAKRHRAPSSPGIVAFAEKPHPACTPNSRSPAEG